MEIVRRVNSMKEVCRKAARRGRKIGLVPTMGALHEGHLSLIRAAKELADVVVVSVFVNPTQFGPGEDYERYPRDLAGDADRAVAEEVNFLFAPEAAEIYLADASTTVEVAGLSDVLEGASRPGHFKGVATVVLKLFEIVRPTLAVFGQKDAQQAAVVRRMVRDLMLDTEVLVRPTVRDEDGLALSSRNRRLSVADRQLATALPRALDAAARAVEDGMRQAEAIVTLARESLEQAGGLEIDYVALVDPASFEPIRQLEDEAVLVAAVRVSDVRLLDNVLLRPPA